MTPTSPSTTAQALQILKKARIAAPKPPPLVTKHHLESLSMPSPFNLSSAHTHTTPSILSPLQNKYWWLQEGTFDSNGEATPTCSLSSPLEPKSEDEDAIIPENATFEQLPDGENCDNLKVFKPKECKDGIVGTTEQERVSIILVERFKKHMRLLDTSTMGTGKTYLAAITAQKLGCKRLLVLGPHGARATWERVCELGRLELSFITFENATGRTIKRGEEGTFTTPTCFNMLERTDVIKERTLKTGRTQIVTKTTFLPTKRFHDLLKSEKIMIVVDEVHSLKNAETARSKAGRAFVAAANGTDCRVLLLSATVVDKKDQVETYLRLLGIVRAPVWTSLGNSSKRIESKEGKPYAFKELQEYINANGGSVDFVSALNVRGKHGLTSTTDLLYEVWKDHICNMLVTAMVPHKHEVHVAYRQCFIDLEEKEEAEAFRENVRILHTALASFTSGATTAMGMFSTMVPALASLQSQKARKVALQINQLLQSHPTAKCLFFFQFYSARDAFLEHLDRRFKDLCLEIHGKIPAKDRDDIVQEFNAPDCAKRVMIASTSVASSSISLHDIHGGFARHSFILPNYLAKDVVQSAGRTVRVNVASEAKVGTVYLYSTTHGIQVDEEHHIMENIMKKCTLMSCAMSEATLLQVPLPSKWLRVSLSKEGVEEPIPEPVAQPDVEAELEKIDISQLPSDFLEQFVPSMVRHKSQTTVKDEPRDTMQPHLLVYTQPQVPCMYTQPQVFNQPQAYNHPQAYTQPQANNQPQEDWMDAGLFDNFLQ